PRENSPRWWCRTRRDLRTLATTAIGSGAPDAAHPATGPNGTASGPAPSRHESDRGPVALRAAALAVGSCPFSFRLIHQDRARALRDRCGVDGPRMRSGGAPELYWRVDDDGALQVFYGTGVHRGSAAVSGSVSLVSGCLA